MKEKTDVHKMKSPADRRAFIKALYISAASTGLGMQTACAINLSTDKIVEDDLTTDLHICRGLNTAPEQVGDKLYKPGTVPATNIPPKDLHGCQGGNTCKGLGGCGTGDYATQYWTTENNCGRSGDDWNGTGGCGVPLGSTNTGFICSQLNNAVPVDSDMPTDYIGVPVWAIARSRFEAKMVRAKKAFDKPETGCGDFTGNAWSPGSIYDRGTLPVPVHKNAPEKPPAPEKKVG